MSTWYRTCPNCRSSLDPGERCNCQDAVAEGPEQETNPQEDMDGQKEKAPACQQVRLIPNELSALYQTPQKNARGVA